MATLAEIRAKLKEQEIKGGSTGSGDLSIYPFWNLKEGGESAVRFLPDGDDSNTFFWVERAMIKLEFAGMKGETDGKKVNVQVPCVEMYNDGSVCPVLSEVRGWFKDPSLEAMGRKYWKKRSYLFQGFVTEDGLKEDQIPDNPIRRFIIGPQIFTLIKGALMDPEMEDLPTDYVHGVDFRLIKSSKGGYADYGTSKWSRRERPLSDAEQAAVKQFGLFSLKDFLPKKPTEVEMKVIKEMFAASVDGEAFDMERWGQYYKPSGASQSTGDPVSSTRASAPVAIDPDLDMEEDRPAKPAKPALKAVSKAAEEKEESKGGDNRANDILAMIRSRQKA
jgi:hypothetical protein